MMIPTGERSSENSDSLDGVESAMSARSTPRVDPRGPSAQIHRPGASWTSSRAHSPLSRAARSHEAIATVERDRAAAVNRAAAARRDAALADSQSDGSGAVRGLAIVVGHTQIV